MCVHSYAAAAGALVVVIMSDSSAFYRREDFASHSVSYFRRFDSEIVDLTLVSVPRTVFFQQRSHLDSLVLNKELSQKRWWYSG